jgi:hypothetical protein
MLVAGCGHGGSHSGSSGGGQSPYQEALDITKCMHQHGDPSFPEPGPNGAFPASGNNNESSAAYQTAAKACRNLPQPAVGGAQFRQGFAALLRYSACMREHGIKNYPDPVMSDTGVSVSIKKGTGPGEVDTKSSQYTSVSAACRSLLPGGGNQQGAGGGQ